MAELFSLVKICERLAWFALAALATIASIVGVLSLFILATYIIGYLGGWEGVVAMISKATSAGRVVTATGRSTDENI